MDLSLTDPFVSVVLVRASGHTNVFLFKKR
jgi:hypothetical protein